MTTKYMRNLKDTIYEDDDYILIRKGVEEIGAFEPSTFLDIIAISIAPLKDWENFGCKHKKDAEEIIESITKELKECLSN